MASGQSKNNGLKKESPEQVMARRRGEVFAPTRDIVSRAKDWTILIGAVAVSLSAVSAVFSYSPRVLDSGPMPFPSRAEVSAVAAALVERDGKDDRLHQDQLDQLKQLAASQQRFAAAQLASERDRLTSRISTTQSALDVAKAIYAKDQSPANQNVVEALESQLKDLRRQVMEERPTVGN